MKRNISIQLKAVLLLIVFGLNTLIGFACAMGVDMSFRSAHHQDEAVEVSVHVHADGKKHEHRNKIDKHKGEKKNTSKKDDCCNEKVVKISQEDRAIPQSNILPNPVFFTAFIATYNNINIFYPSQVTSSIRYFVRCYHPPIPDIRIVIQSFQI